jgi:hypothetical protein
VVLYSSATLRLQAYATVVINTQAALAGTVSLANNTVLYLNATAASILVGTVSLANNTVLYLNTAASISNLIVYGTNATIQSSAGKFCLRNYFI